MTSASCYQRKCCGSVVECLTRDQGAACLSLTDVTALCPWARHINPSLVLLQHRKTSPYINERLLMDRKESNQTIKSCYQNRPPMYNRKMRNRQAETTSTCQSFKIAKFRCCEYLVVFSTWLQSLKNRALVALWNFLVRNSHWRSSHYAVMHVHNKNSNI